MNFRRWRALHRAGSGTVGALGVVHCAVTPMLYDRWSPQAVWFLGTGVGLFTIAVVNWAHVGEEPCTLPTAKVVRWLNVVYVALGVGAVIAVPEPQAFLILAGLALQAVAGFATLRSAAA